MLWCFHNPNSTQNLVMTSRPVILIAPDKWKGSLSVFEVCDVLEEAARKAFPHAVILLRPLADGGDGFAAVVKHYLHTQTIKCPAENPLGRPLNAAYEWDPETKTAYIELASAAGLMRLQPGERDPLRTHTRGVGLLAKHALKKGASRLLIGLGGSATNDGGMGFLSAFGMRFEDAAGKPLAPCGANLAGIAKIHVPHGLPKIEVKLLTDVQNRLTGQTGAARVYAPQKGAGPEVVELLENGLIHWAKILQTFHGKNLAAVAGTGAAGGFPAGLLTFFNTHLLNGFTWIAKLSGLEKQMKSASLVITGEGKTDEQSFMGKPVGEIARLAADAHKPCFVFCGKNEIKENPDKRIRIYSLTAHFADRKDHETDARQLLKEMAGKAFNDAEFFPGRTNQSTG